MQALVVLVWSTVMCLALSSHHDGAAVCAAIQAGAWIIRFGMKG